MLHPLVSSRRILIVTDAWRPQINGVVRTLESISRELTADGHLVQFLTPERFWTVPVPHYPEVRLSLASGRAVARQIDNFGPDHIHIATEGPLGLQARQYCLARALHFTTSFHTRFPEYLAPTVPEEWSYGYLRWFHAPAAQTLVPTQSVREELESRGFRHLSLWSRGVDAERFRPGAKSRFSGLPGPHLLYVGRVSAEKNVEAFLALDVPGTKIVVGDGPDGERLRRLYPEAVFAGYQHGEALGEFYRSADVLVFPSRTDTFGNVITEALASGTPVAAYPVPGPRDILHARAGAMDADLRLAVLQALTLDRADARQLALDFTWTASAGQFFGALVETRAEHAQIA
jgi:glycosyltransferase involved in cell wall biosynthesis